MVVPGSKSLKFKAIGKTDAWGANASGGLLGLIKSLALQFLVA